MSLLTPSAAKGQPFFEGSSSLRQHDNASDNLVAGAYSHNPLEASATEADEWTSVLFYLFQVAKAGGGAIAVRNTTGGVLNAGPVKILTPGYDVANGAFLIGVADAAGNNAANALLLASLANNTNGVAYLGGTFTGALDTSASTIGNPVYLAAGGGMTLTAPTAADHIQQIIGRVQALANPGTIAGLLTAPLKIGTSFHQALSITNALIANATLDLAAKVTGVLPVPNGGTGAATLGTSRQPLLGNGAGALTAMAAPTSGDANADAIAGTSASAKKALVLQGSASQSANIFEIQNSLGIVQFAISLGSSTATGPNDTNLGLNAGVALTSGSNNTNVGVNAGAAVNSGSFNTNVGSFAGAAITTGGNNTIIGKNAAATLSTGSSNIVLGSDADVASSGASNSFVAGSPANPVADVYFGKGIAAAASSGGSDWNLNGNGGNGSNQAGGNVVLAGGKGTGNAEPGLILVKYPLKGSTGSTLESLSTQKFPVATVMYTLTGDATITTPTTSASLIAGRTGVGSNSLEGGLMRAGRTLRVRAIGRYSTSATPPNIQIDLKFGSTVVATTGMITPYVSVVTKTFSIEATATCRAYGGAGVGSIQGEGQLMIGSNSTVNAYSMYQAPTSIDLTATQALDLLVTYSANTAGNSIAITSLVIEVLN
jgi:hypothetical protein